MNAYLCITEDVKVLQEYVAGYPRYERCNAVDVVFAETRGKAKSAFASKHAFEFEFTDVDHVQLIARDVERQSGVAKYDDSIWSDPLWDHVGIG